jgi:hypothetical protein
MAATMTISVFFLLYKFNIHSLELINGCMNIVFDSVGIHLKDKS